MPSLNYLERTILIASDNKDMFREKFLFQPDEQASPQSTHSRELSQDSRRRTFINLTSGNRFQLPSQAGPKDCHFFETKIVYTGRKIPIQIPITGTLDIVGDVLPPSPIILTILVLGDSPNQLFFRTSSFITTTVPATSSSHYLRTPNSPHYSPDERNVDKEANCLYRLRSSVGRSSAFRPCSLCYCLGGKRDAPGNHRTRISLHRSLKSRRTH